MVLDILGIRGCLQRCACARACVRERERGDAISRAESAVSVPARARRCAGEGGLREVRLAGRVGSGDGRMEERPPFSLGRVRSVIRGRFTSRTAFELSLSFFQAAVLPSSSFLTVTCGRGEGA